MHPSRSIQDLDLWYVAAFHFVEKRELCVSEKASFNSHIGISSIYLLSRITPTLFELNNLCIISTVLYYDVLIDHEIQKPAAFLP